MGEFLRHPLVVTSAGVLLAGLLALFARGIAVGRRLDATLGEIKTYVLPHFIPPTAEEIRIGVVDNTLPKRTERQEHNLADHLKTETELTEKTLKRIDAIEKTLKIRTEENDA